MQPGRRAWYTDPMESSTPPTGSLVRIQQRERFVPVDLRGDPATLAAALARVPIWRRAGGAYDHLPSGTLATLVHHHRGDPWSRPTGMERCEVMLASGEIVNCYAAHLEPVDPTPPP